ncbi:MAG: hypothetical protein DRO94_01755 [Candidatus Altiarchaeales archaeon]|nr:MAG: hypothetical protein DRO95_01990 [Candidatus Altiarchaeales archaeon]RLI94910.1 MAG: hypothetical protein DRO94_01755 [Candidatus Altiarchaeales archaeon]HDO82155.1 hypothetical protein [Candidatus Altiarchaeales archaeon]HEX54804.1 hypothetical protein [Candidatus Altiarchaeales archaeon]
MTNLDKILIIIFFIFLITFPITVVDAQPACNAFSSPYKEICENVSDALCKILLLIQGISSAVATFMLIWAGLKWLTGGLQGPQEIDEARKMMIGVFVGLVIIAVAAHFVNYLFGQDIGSFYCG